MIPKTLLALIAAAILLAPQASNLYAQGLDARFSFEELAKMADEAEVLVRGRAGPPVIVPDAPRGLDYAVPFEVIELYKGTLTEKAFQLRLSSTATELMTRRNEVAGKEFVLPLAAVEEIEGAYKLSAGAGFAVGSNEALRLMEMAAGKVERTVVSPLRLHVEPLRPSFPLGQPAIIVVRLENPSEETILFEQAPIEVRDGNLYLAGNGFIDVIKSSQDVAAKETLKIRQSPEEPTPAAILPKESLRKEIDLTEYFDFQAPGVYSVTVAVTTPRGELLRSTIPVQISAAGAAGVERPAVGDGGEASDIIIPSPEIYTPGQPVNGLSMLLKPVKAEYTVGEPIQLELRLINSDERGQPVHIDVRLERTLMLQVKEQGDSPAARSILQKISWGDTPAEGVTPYAYLRPRAFWGNVININSLYGVDVAAVLQQDVNPEKLMPVQINYERYGMTLFSFEKPGVYRVDATYFVQPQPGTVRIWAGKLTSNHVFIRVKPAAADDQESR